MKCIQRILFTLFLLFIFPISVFAAPFLCSDPQINIEFYDVKINGVTETSVPQILNDGTVRLHHDLQGLANGPHEVEVRAGNIWGWSDWTPPFSFLKQVPGDVPGICISEE